MRSLVCLYLVVVKSAVAAVAGPTTVGGIAVVLVPAGLVGTLPEAELEVVLAYEVAHPTNRQPVNRTPVYRISRIAHATPSGGKPIARVESPQTAA
jgi:Zn-dependent protease with chaperone function